MSLSNNKRTIYQAQINNSASIGSDQTIVPVLIKKIIKDVTKTGTNAGTPYYKLIAVCMADEPTFIKKRNKNSKKQKVEGDSESEAEDASQNGQENSDKGSTLNSGDEFLITTYDRAAGSLDIGVIVKVAMSSDTYNNRPTYLGSKVLIDKLSNVLTEEVYNTMLIKNQISEIPTTDNVKEDDFPIGTDEKYMNRTFVLPLSVENKKFSNVEIQIADDETDRFFSLSKDSPDQFIGINTNIGDKTINMFKVVYTHPETDSKTMMSFAYSKDIFDCFGCANLDRWMKVAPRFIFNAIGWFVYGYSSLRRLEGIVGDDSSEENPFNYSTGFVTRMNVDLKKTVERIGIPLSIDYIEQVFGSDSDYQNDIEFEQHPLNSGWKVSVKRNKPYTINLTDLSADQVETFIKEYRKVGSTAKFYGIFKDDTPYELTDNVEDEISEKGLIPDMVFVINN